MTESNDQDRKTPLKLSQPGKLELKKTVETGQVRQSFSHGRSKVVTVEVRKKRTFAPGASGAMHEVKESHKAAEAELPVAAAAAAAELTAASEPAPAPEPIPAVTEAAPEPAPAVAEAAPEPAPEPVAVQPEPPAPAVAEVPAAVKAEAQPKPVAAAAPAPAAPPQQAPRPARPMQGGVVPPPPPTRQRQPQRGGSGRDLSQNEKETRFRVLIEARKAEEEARKQAVIRAAEDARRKVEEEARRKVEEEERIRREAEEAVIRATAEEARRKAEEEARLRGEEIPAPQAGKPKLTVSTKPGQGKSAAAAPAAAPAAPGVKPKTAEEEEEEERAAKRVGSVKAPAHKPAPVPAAKRGEPRRRTGKLTITAALDDQDRGERGRSLAAVRRARERERQKQLQKAQEKVIRDVVIPETISVQELANRMAERGADVIKALMRMGVMANINQVIDADTAELVVTEFGHNMKRVAESDVELGLKGIDDSEGELIRRPPVVTVMGHVDHGKTSLLDALRATDVVSGEAGGITQHIGAYQVTMKTGDKITFIDTPGHEAFTAMRARGAKVTDIVVLVVAADDGIMPQTVEAIRHARAAGVPVVVAINKVDKPGANPERVRQELLQHELVVEELGGDVLAIEVSAKKRLNLDKLEEGILLQAEILDLKANPQRSAQGVVIEAKMERGRGSVATVLVQRGTLRVGDVFVAGSEWGRVRALVDDHGNKVESAGPSTPVEVLGLQGTPSAGDEFTTVESETRAREVAGYRQRKDRDAKATAGARGTLEQMFSRIAAGEAKELPVVIKGDVQGSVEAIVSTLEKMGNENVKVRVLHSAVGGINESDVTLAKASGALVVGFNVRANPQARDLARRDDVDIRYYSIIYDVADDVRTMLTGLLAPTLKENFLGYAQIRDVFNITKVGKVAGCYITEGTVKRGAKVRLLRDNVVIHEGNLSTLKRFKDDVKEVRESYECGMSFDNYNDIQVGDMIECFEVEEVAATL